MTFFYIEIKPHGNGIEILQMERIWLTTSKQLAVNNKVTSGVPQGCVL